MPEPTTAQVRAWARENGHAVADRGRITAAVQSAYTSAHQDRRPAEAPLDEVDAPAQPTPDVAEPITHLAPSPPASVGAPAATWSDGSRAGWAPPSPAHEWDPAPLPPSDPSRGPDGYAIASLVLGLLPIMCGLFAVVFGIVALGRIRLSQRPGRGLAIAGIVLGIGWFVVFLAAVFLRVLVGSDAYS